jgi:hypothetical protein
MAKKHFFKCQRKNFSTNKNLVMRICCLQGSLKDRPISSNLKVQTIAGTMKTVSGQEKKVAILTPSNRKGCDLNSKIEAETHAIYILE